jgi:streptogramin lyase
MKFFYTVGCVLTAFSITALAGCGGSQPPIGTGTAPQTSALTPHVDRGTSWMLPEAKSEELLYVAGAEPVDVYTYPQGKMVGSLGTFRGPDGMCVDQGGDVFITIYYDNQVLEYAHGGSTPIATINTANFPADCSIDPTTGNLAVTFWDGIQIFSHPSSGWSGPQTYTQPDGTYFTYFCAYDDSGDLFFDADTQHSAFQLTELPAGSSGNFTTVSVNQRFSEPGGVLWDGNYLSIAELSRRRKRPAVVHQFSITGSNGTEVGSTTLRKAREGLFWIQGSTIISEARGDVGFWNYPEGGRPEKIVHTPDGAGGVAVSPGN